MPPGPAGPPGGVEVRRRGGSPIDFGFGFEPPGVFSFLFFACEPCLVAVSANDARVFDCVFAA